MEMENLRAVREMGILSNSLVEDKCHYGDIWRIDINGCPLCGEFDIK